MGKSLKILLIAAFIPFFLFSCGSEPEQQTQPVRRARPPKPPAPPPSAEPEVKAVVDDGKPKRNPFLSHIILLGDEAKSKKVRGPLECCELNLFRLLAVVKGKDKNIGYALVQAPDNKRYIVRRGDVIGLREGRIIRVNSSSITIREHTRDSEGKIVSTIDEEISLPVKKNNKPAR